MPNRGLGNQTFANDVTIGDVGIEFVKDSVKTPVVEDTATKANNDPMPSGMFYKDAAGDYIPVNELTGLPVQSPQLPATLGQKVSAASTSVVLSTEQEAKLDQLIAAMAPKDIVAAIYHNALATPVTVAGTIVGVVGVAVKAMTILNNANSVRVEIGGELAGVSLPGSPLSVDVTTVSGNVVLFSLVGADITGGDFAINIEG